MPAKLQQSFQRELTNANRGHIAPLVPGVIKDAAGKTVWVINSYKFLGSDTACPPTVNEKLWRQGQLTVKQGLFEVVPGICQLRSLDISNMTIEEGENGIIVIDPLVSCEPATAGLELYRSYRDPERKRKVMGLVYTHSHTDHFGGAGGILESTREKHNTADRSVYMYGMALEKGADGHVGNGLGIASSMRTRSLIIINGVRMVFHVVSGTEAPAEVNVHFPNLRALLIAETATVSMHNITTLRGAQVRDAKAWSNSLDEAITVRLMNLGLTGTEIAEQLRLPSSLENSWHCQGIRYVECIGGLSSLCDKAEGYIAKQDFRFAATLLSHAVSAFPDHQRSRSLLAGAYQNLAYISENGPWRNFYLTEAQGLRTSTRPGESELGRSPLGETLTVGQWFEILSVQVDGQKAGDSHFVIEIVVTDTKEAWRLTISNGVLNYRQQSSGSVVGEELELSIIMSKMGLLDVLRGSDIDEVPGAEHSGDLDLLDKFLDIISDQSADVTVPDEASLVIELRW
ncbi:hypothetical protein KVR01_006396 [Diaporthe batatas]|uniref:uncharacterized protein n=1 Tax=Diaporthe batatas TaxID=748121 RepID=UPI001D047D09|nr:uncharacterized protein KVR01_006396 [Diaporthe batatas]KAG8164478.1 hypothetical protein KVR01_006396 [Diaporthe batatas]